MSWGKSALIGVAAWTLAGCPAGGPGPTTTQTSAEQQAATLAATQCGFQPTAGTIRKVAAGLGAGGSDPAAVAAAICRAA